MEYHPPRCIIKYCACAVIGHTPISREKRLCVCVSLCNPLPSVEAKLARRGIQFQTKGKCFLSPLAFQVTVVLCCTLLLVAACRSVVGGDSASCVCGQPFKIPPLSRRSIVTELVIHLVVSELREVRVCVCACVRVRVRVMFVGSFSHTSLFPFLLLSFPSSRPPPLSD